MCHSENHIVLFLPFDITHDKLAKLGITSVKTMTGTTEDGTSLVINFNDEKEIHAGVPYILFNPNRPLGFMSEYDIYYNS